MLLWAFYQTRRSTPISQGQRHMESQPSKDQTKSPGRHRSAPLPNWYQLASWPFLTQPMGCENELMDLGNHGMAGGSLSLQSLCQKQTLSMKRCLPAKVFWLVTSIPNYIHLDSRNHNIEPQIELESIDAQPRAMGSNRAKPMQWYHQWFIEIASTISSIFNHNHPCDAFNMVPCGRSM